MITKLTGLTSLETPIGTISGPPGIQADDLLIQLLVDSISYLLPNCEIVILPFCISQIGEWYAQADGIADYKNFTIYLSAFSPLDHQSSTTRTAQQWRELDWLQTVAHELGHMVHNAYLPRHSYGQPESLWATFKQVHRLTTLNTDYQNGLDEAFAETWRLIFVPQTRGIPHKQGVNWQVTGLKEWFLSLTGLLGLAVGHNKAYLRGEVIPLEVGPAIIGGRAMVPLRFVAERLGCEVVWSDPETISISQRVPNSQ